MQRETTVASGVRRTITEITRRAIFDWLSVSDAVWHGQLDEVEFLGRVFKLDALPSYDGRRRN